MIPRRLQRYVLLLLAILGVIYLTATRSSDSLFGSVSSINTSDSKILGKGYEWVFKLLETSDPSLQPLVSYKNGEKAKEKFATDQDFVFSKKYLSNLLEVDKLSLYKLKETHKQYLDDITEDKHKSFNSELTKPSGDGIVFVGGIKFTWLALIGIEQLRNTGCDLPIEVFIGNEDEYEEEFCEVILPRYNGRCTLLFKEVDTSKLKISGYQYKNLAFLISKFQRILFLDADNVPLRDPKPLFDSKVFNKNGLVIWPDAWSRTTHPAYYEIAGLNVTNKIVRGPYKGSDSNLLDLETEVSFHDLENTLPNPSSESGMILVDKSKHVKTLLLSLYYNIYGPKLYYSLFSQGSAGEGDKETFIAAATVLSADYYQVLQPFKFIGYHYDGKFNSKALGQADPVQDYENFLKGTHLNQFNQYVASKSAIEPKVLFMHLSYPKLIPFALLNDNEIIKEGNEHVRMYGAATDIAGYDFELRIFQIISGALCEKYEGESPILEKLVGLKLKEYWGQDPNTFCSQLIEHTNWLKENAE